MHNLNYKHYLYAIGLFLSASVVSLWSWNTIAELFGLPLAQYKHVLAAFCLLFILKWTLSIGYRNDDRKIGWDCEHPNH